MVGICDREYLAELIFELVSNGLQSDHAIEACQLVAEGDQCVVHSITFGCCHSPILKMML